MTTENFVSTDSFKGNVKMIEMSRYIDLDIYHRVERTHPFYIEMVQEACEQLKNFLKGKKSVKIMEIGAGTGLLTAEILKYPEISVDAIEIDEECCKIHKKYVDDKRCDCICADAVTFCKKGAYDAVVSAFAHDHIHYSRKHDFVRNIRENLKDGGIYIMGGEILPYYVTEDEKKKALYDYHSFIINKALKDRNFEVAQIEINALKSGLDMKGDFKRHEKMFEEEMASSGLRLESKRKIGPLDIDNVGGVFVYVYYS